MSSDSKVKVEAAPTGGPDDGLTRQSPHRPWFQPEAEKAGPGSELEALQGMDIDGLRVRYRQLHRKAAPAHLPRWLLLRIVAYRAQALALGDLDPETIRFIDRVARDQKRGRPKEGSGGTAPAGQSGADGTTVAPVPYRLRPGTQLVREHNGALHRVVVMEQGFSWNGRIFSSLSEVARTITGTSWNGPAFFGLRSRKGLSVTEGVDGTGKSGASP